MLVEHLLVLLPDEARVELVHYYTQRSNIPALHEAKAHEIKAMSVERLIREFSEKKVGQRLAEIHAVNRVAIQHQDNLAIVFARDLEYLK